jgi:hypothetical protein
VHFSPAAANPAARPPEALLDSVNCGEPRA